ncbi:MAG: riboflavin synthase [Actinomycetota bacterium]|nr:riboflavin synthase [Actinomycetota bacterium]
MFTGIVEELGEVVRVDRRHDAVRISLRGPLVASDVQCGDSIAVSGCCLTVAARDTDTLTADVMRETLDRTVLGALAPGAPVNLERAVHAQARLGGHLVQGHVDGVGTITERSPSKHWEIVRVSVPAPLARYVAVKGSIAVDGVSLTVIELEDETPSLTVGLIPTTLALTTLGRKRVGDPVNLEVDVLAKYVERLVTAKEVP